MDMTDEQVAEYIEANRSNPRSGVAALAREVQEYRALRSRIKEKADTQRQIDAVGASRLAHGAECHSFTNPRGRRLRTGSASRLPKGSVSEADSGPQT